MYQTLELIGMDHALIGTMVASRYQIQRLLAKGGMGRLYLAIQQPLGRKVVVKVMTPPEILNTDPVALQARFFREASACARLQHPNTVTLFDYGELTLPEAGKTFYMVMEYIDGHDLSVELTEHGRISPQRALRLGVQIAGSLQEAHGLGVVHRDLKPSNVMLIGGHDGDRVKVLDFGIAKLLAALDEGANVAELTRKGDVVGSPSYMSPEQVQHDQIDARSDIYSLGAMLFHLIAGRRPYRALSATMRMMAHVRRPTPSIRKVAGEDIHPAVDALLQRCMAKDPAERYPDAAALIEALNMVLVELRQPLPSALPLAAVPEEPPPAAVPTESMEPTLNLSADERVVSRPAVSLLWVALACGLLGFGLGLLILAAAGGLLYWLWPSLFSAL